MRTILIFLCAASPVLAQSLDDPAGRLFTEEILTISIQFDPSQAAMRPGEASAPVAAQFQLGGEWIETGEIVFDPVDDRADPRPPVRLRIEGADGSWASDLQMDPGVADPSLMARYLGFQLARRMDVPALRSGHAVLVLNGQPMGLYAITERPSKTWAMWVSGGSAGAAAFEGHSQDIFRELTLGDEFGAAHEMVLGGLRAGCVEPERRARMERIGRFIDTGEFYRFMALETVIRHGLGYCDGALNYVVVVDPSRQRARFVSSPFDYPFVGYNFPVLTRKRGAVAKAMVGTGEGRHAYLNTLSTLVGDPELEGWLVARVEERRAAMAPHVDESVLVKRLDPSRAFLRRLITRRLADIRKQLATLSNLSAQDLEEMEPEVPRVVGPRGKLPVRSETDFGTRFKELIEKPAASQEAGFSGFSSVHIDAPEGVLEELHWRSTNWVVVSVSWDGQHFDEVGLRLKGQASRQGFNGKPSLTLKFNHIRKGQKLDGQTKLHLNNARFDRSLLNQYTGAWLFKQAGLPAPGVSHSRVTINGRDYGIFVTVQGTTKSFLEEHFGDRDALLLEGSGTDVDGPLDLDSGYVPPGTNPGAVLHTAALRAIESRSLNPLEEVCDLTRLAGFVALETVLGHWDGYSQALNNYRICRPTHGRFVLVPHGMDALALDNDDIIFPYFRGVLARALIGSPEGRDLYAQEMFRILESLDMDAFTLQVARLSQSFRSALEPATPWEASGQLAAAQALVGTLGDRQAFLLSQLRAFNSNLSSAPSGQTEITPHE